MNKKYLYKGKIYKIFRKKVDLGKVVFEKDYIEGKDRAVIIPITKENKFLLIRFPQLAISEDKISFSLRFPRGVINKSENSEETAKRELLEETGHKAGEIKKISSFVYPNPAVIKERWDFLIAKDLEKVKNYTKDKFEDWGMVELSGEEIEKKIKTGEINDASAIVAFYLYKLSVSG